MAQISGFHHVSLPATNVERSSDWYERVFGFECILIEEEEDHVKAVILEHPAGMLLVLHLSPDLVPASSGRGLGTAVLSFRVPSQNDLLLWENRLTVLGIDHSGARQAHLGWALDVVDPSGLRVQLHTREVISADDE